ncbi:hypothetical protein CMI48_00615 [Candidatus Pacearchaeota archaeon]|nr:hypothetical protein [Candidatus Pacearchaeota archaeon]
MRDYVGFFRDCVFPRAVLVGAFLTLVYSIEVDKDLLLETIRGTQTRLQAERVLYERQLVLDERNRIRRRE